MARVATDGSAACVDEKTRTLCGFFRFPRSTGRMPNGRGERSERATSRAWRRADPSALVPVARVQLEGGRVMRQPAVLLAFLLLLVAANISAQAACVPAPTERCADDRLAAQIAGLLTPAELAFVSIGKDHHTRAIGVAADEFVWSRIAGRERDPGLRAIAAQMLIDSYLRTGLDARAIALFDSLDAPTRDAMSTGPLIFGTNVSGSFGMVVTLYVEASPQLTAAGLALALAEVDRVPEANALLVRAARAVDIGPAQSWAGDLVVPSMTAATCVRAMLDADARTDWFLWAFELSPARRGASCGRAVVSRGFHRRMLRQLRAAGLPERWMPKIEPNDSPDSVESYQHKLDAALATLPAIRARIAALQVELAGIDRLDAKDLGDPEWTLDDAADERAVEPSARDRELARILAERLAAPVYNPYRIAPSTPSAGVEVTAGEHPAKCSSSALRCQEVDGIRWELRNSQDYDPTGEVPAAGFWLRRIAGAGESARDYYLGIKEHNPFELVDADGPLVRDGQLRLSVRRAQIDLDRITFPPIGLQFHGDDDVLELGAAISDIARDTDADGLTDLAEQQLLLDPRDSDSDGDGIEDAKDRLPGVAFDRARDRQQGLIAAALDYILREPDDAVTVGVPASAQLGKRHRSDQRTLFLVADPDDLVHVTSDRRIVVLPIDRKLLDRHPSFAVFLPMRMSLRMLDGHHAELEYSTGWSGGTLVLHLRDGVWRAAGFDGWIS
jgi:hypothetical protein